MKFDSGLMCCKENIIEWTVPEGWADTVTVNMPVSASVPGIMRAGIREDSGKTVMSFNTEAYVRLSELLERGEKGSLRRACLTVCDALNSADEYMLDPASLLLDTDFIYCTPDLRGGGLLCLPGINAEAGQDCKKTAAGLLVRAADIYLSSGCVQRSEAGLARALKAGIFWEAGFGMLRRFAELGIMSAGEEDTARLMNLADGKIYRMAGDNTLIGRGAACGISLDGAKYLSRRHARFAKRGMGWTLSDLGSSNGSFVNGRRLSEGEVCRLEGGEELRFADCRFVFCG